MSATTRRADDEQHAGAVTARAIRETVADQLHDLVIERDSMGSDVEFIKLVRQVGHTGRLISEARGRQLQARTMGLPLAPAVREEREALELLRATVMSCGAACGLWAAGMDLEASKLRELEQPPRNGRRRKPADEDTI